MLMIARPSRVTWWFNLAREAARRGTCPRLQVGAILIIDDAICGVSYNGAPKGEPHCQEAGCIIDEEHFGPHCLRAAHAEMNLLIGAARQGIAVDGGTVVVTHYPCPTCMKALQRAGIERIYYMYPYGKQMVQHAGRPFMHAVDPVSGRELGMISAAEAADSYNPRAG